MGIGMSVQGHGKRRATAAMIALFLLTSALATPALAQDVQPAAAPADLPATVPASAVPPSNPNVFPDTYFAQYSPRTALDMVQQLPGFTIESQNNGGNRGLGAARENVLINGERIAKKSLDAVTALSRIAAANVLRIELLDGGSLNVPG